MQHRPLACSKAMHSTERWPVVVETQAAQRAFQDRLPLEPSAEEQPGLQRRVVEPRRRGPVQPSQGRPPRTASSDGQLLPGRRPGKTTPGIGGVFPNITLGKPSTARR